MAGKSKIVPKYAPTDSSLICAIAKDMLLGTLCPAVCWQCWPRQEEASLGWPCCRVEVSGHKQTITALCGEFTLKDTVTAQSGGKKAKQERLQKGRGF